MFASCQFFFSEAFKSEFLIKELKITFCVCVESIIFFSHIELNLMVYY